MKSEVSKIPIHIPAPASRASKIFVIFDGVRTIFCQRRFTEQVFPTGHLVPSYSDKQPVIWNAGHFSMTLSIGGRNLPTQERRMEAAEGHRDDSTRSTICTRDNEAKSRFRIYAGRTIRVVSENCRENYRLQTFWQNLQDGSCASSFSEDIARC